MKEPKDKKARKASMKAFEKHLKAGSTIDTWNKSNDITAKDVRGQAESAWWHMAHS
jgi:hypothetical protein